MKVYVLEYAQTQYCYDAAPATSEIFASKKALELFVKRKIAPWYNQPARLAGGRKYGLKKVMKEGGYSIRKMNLMSVKDVLALPIDDPNS